VARAVELFTTVERDPLRKELYPGRATFVDGDLHLNDKTRARTSRILAATA